jgi:hypothetical protein
MTDEEYVRSKWENVAEFNGAVGKSMVYWISGSECSLSLLCSSLEGAWQAARQFTEQRKREIAEVDEEVALLIWLEQENEMEEDSTVARRIRERLQAIRADLAKGMKS